MSAHAKLAPEQQMTIEEFLAFTDSRPDEERWELIEGMPVFNPSPIDYHQIVVTNVVAFLVRIKVETNAPWFPLVGTGTRVPASANSLPQPDAMVKEHAPTGSPVSDDALVLFEVLSQQHQGRPGLAAQGLCQRAELPALRDRLTQGGEGRRLRPRQCLGPA
jgi:Uma2 family endonuclease